MTKNNVSQSAVIKSPSDLGALVQQTRKQSKLKQAEAAAMCGVGTRFLSDLENGKPSLHLGKTLQVMKAFGLLVTVKKKELIDQ